MHDMDTALPSQASQPSCPWPDILVHLKLVYMLVDGPEPMGCSTLQLCYAFGYMHAPQLADCRWHAGSEKVLHPELLHPRCPTQQHTRFLRGSYLDKSCPCDSKLDTPKLMAAKCGGVGTTLYMH